MTTKLTLSIQKETVERAKRISRKRGKSISKMFEEYLNNIIEKEKDVNPLETILEITQKHKSKINLPSDRNYNKLVNDLRYEDFRKKGK